MSGPFGFPGPVARLARCCLVPLFAALLGAQDRPPTPDESKAALQRTLAEPKQIAFLIDALQTHGRTEDDEVVKLVGKALAHTDPLVKTAAIKALRYNHQPSALTLLLAHAGDEKLLADETLAAAYYLALGQKEDAKILPVLTKGLHVERGDAVVTARVQAIGRVRKKEAVDELMQFLKSGSNGGGARGNVGGGKNGRSRPNPHLAAIAVSLTVLTGQDFGRDETGWIRWWAEVDDKFVVPAKGALPKKAAAGWEAMWAEPPMPKVTAK